MKRNKEKLKSFLDWKTVVIRKYNDHDEARMFCIFTVWIKPKGAEWRHKQMSRKRELLLSILKIFEVGSGLTLATCPLDQSSTSTSWSLSLTSPVATSFQSSSWTQALPLISSPVPGAAWLPGMEPCLSHTHVQPQHTEELIPHDQLFAYHYFFYKRIHWKNKTEFKIVIWMGQSWENHRHIRTEAKILWILFYM